MELSCRSCLSSGKVGIPSKFEQIEEMNTEKWIAMISGSRWCLSEVIERSMTFCPMQ